MIMNAGVHCYDATRRPNWWQPAMWPTFKFLRLLVGPGPAAANLNLKSSGPGRLRAPPGYYEIACQCQWVAT